MNKEYNIYLEFENFINLYPNDIKKFKEFLISLPILEKQEYKKVIPLLVDNEYKKIYIIYLKKIESKIEELQNQKIISEYVAKLDEYYNLVNKSYYSNRDYEKITIKYRNIKNNFLQNKNLQPSDYYEFLIKNFNNFANKLLASKKEKKKKITLISTLSLMFTTLIILLVGGIPVYTYEKCVYNRTEGYELTCIKGLFFSYH